MLTATTWAKDSTPAYGIKFDPDFRTHETGAGSINRINAGRKVLLTVTFV
ncbi:MAG: hypothetical protein ABR557_03045 [Pyrinomonadaceae bacterium]